MDTIYALEQAAKSRIAELHQQKAQQNLSALVAAQNETNNQITPVWSKNSICCRRMFGIYYHTLSLLDNNILPIVTGGPFTIDRF